jgi:hypothetical protein
MALGQCVPSDDIPEPKCRMLDREPLLPDWRPRFASSYHHVVSPLITATAALYPVPGLSVVLVNLRRTRVRRLYRPLYRTLYRSDAAIKCPTKCPIKWIAEGLLVLSQ